MATDLKGELTCPICMELFQRPLRLPCGHSYCRNCLQAFIGQQSQKDIVTGQHRPVKCPECRYMLDVTAEGADNFPVDFKLSKLVDVYMRMEDMENRNEIFKTKDGDQDPKNADTNDPDPGLVGACGYTPVSSEPGKPETEVKAAPDMTRDDECCTVDSLPRERTLRKTVYGEESATESEKELSDDSTNRTGPRRRKRRNKVIRFFASLLSLSSSDGEYDLREASSSSSDIDTSRPVRDVKPAASKEVPKRRNRWGFFTSSSSESEQNVASSSDDEAPRGPPPRRKPPRKSPGVMSSIQRRFKPSSSDAEDVN